MKSKICLYAAGRFTSKLFHVGYKLVNISVRFYKGINLLSEVVDWIIEVFQGLKFQVNRVAQF